MCFLYKYLYVLPEYALNDFVVIMDFFNVNKIVVRMGTNGTQNICCGALHFPKYLLAWMIV